jgi:DNA-binding NarL/FixJ family response regulator
MQGSNRSAVILDHYLLWCEAVRRVLERQGIDVLASVGTPEEALQLAREHQPDLLVVEIRTPGTEVTAPSCIHTLREELPDLKVIVLSESDKQRDVDEAFAAGAHAYVVKSTHPDDLASAVRQAFAPSIFFRNDLPLDREEHVALELPRQGRVLIKHGLTRREFEILQLVAEGHSNSEVAKMLWVTEQTVKFHLSNVYRKLGVSNRTEASRWAQLHNMLPSRDERAEDVVPLL